MSNVGAATVFTDTRTVIGTLGQFFLYISLLIIDVSEAIDGRTKLYVEATLHMERRGRMEEAYECYVNIKYQMLISISALSNSLQIKRFSSPI